MIYRLHRSFFFQAEDGIRDLVRSRGLGDVYKRQGYSGPPAKTEHARDASKRTVKKIVRWEVFVFMVFLVKFNFLSGVIIASVSYTHLTLPTSDLV